MCSSDLNMNSTKINKKGDKRLGEVESRSVKTRDEFEGFHLLENSQKLCRGFHQAMKARRTCFISFIKLFSVSTKRKTIYEARMYT